MLYRSVASPRRRSPGPLCEIICRQVRLIALVVPVVCLHAHLVVPSVVANQRGHGWPWSTPPPSLVVGVIEIWVVPRALVGWNVEGLLWNARQVEIKVNWIVTRVACPAYSCFPSFSTAKVPLEGSNAGEKSAEMASPVALPVEAIEFKY